MAGDFLHPERDILKNGDHLPHWQQGEVMQFVTFRLADSLPLARVQEWKAERERWMLTFPKPWDNVTEREFHRKFSTRIESWLDGGAGSCIFMDEGKRNALSGILMRFHGEKFHHEAWVIMPNHVHLLFRPVMPLGQLVQTWKSTFARSIGCGPIWQRNYRDTMIRDMDHFINAVRYIRNNPAKGNLPGGHYSAWESERAKCVP